MATFVTFRGYGVQGKEIEINIERVTHFWSIDYNGNAGVELALDTGKIVQVHGYHHDVSRKIHEAIAAKAQQLVLGGAA